MDILLIGMEYNRNDTWISVKLVLILFQQSLKWADQENNLENLSFLFRKSNMSFLLLLPDKGNLQSSQCCLQGQTYQIHILLFWFMFLL